MKLVHRVRHASSRLIGVPSMYTYDRRVKSTFTEFAKQHKLLYFDSFDTSDNDAHVVRGMTLGLSSQDTHCLIGASGNYDLVCVYRQDKTVPEHFWTIMAFDLHTAVNLPHILIGQKAKAKSLFDSQLGIHRDMQPYEFERPEEHSKKFIKRFSVYSPPAYARVVEHIITPELSGTLMERLPDALLEVESDTVYVMADYVSLTAEYLENLLQTGIIIANQIDKQMGNA